MTKEDEVVKTKTRKRRKGWKIARKAFVVFLIIGLAVFGGYYFRKYNNLRDNPPPSDEIRKQENQRVISKVAKLYNVPKDEEPTIYYLSNKDALQDDLKKQEFFQKAMTGDYALIYEKAKIAILFRPSNNQLVDVKPLNVQGTSKSLSIAIIGAQTNRDEAEKTLKDAFKTEVTIKSKSDAKNGYTGYTVIDLTGKYTEQAKKIAESLKGQVGTLPPGEDKPDGIDILVVAGAPLPQ